MLRTLHRHVALLVAAAILIAGALTQPLKAQFGGPQYISLDGVNDYASIADAPSLSFGTGAADTPLTIETWFHPDSMTVKQNVISKWGAGATEEYKLHITRLMS